MHKIDRIKVTGFWEAYDFETTIFPDVTFFIGANGSGKTTLINLIAAVLFADIATLQRIPFSSIEITLAPSSGNKKPSITVIKKTSQKRPYQGIQFRIKESQSADEKTFSLDELSDHFLARRDETDVLLAAEYQRMLRRQPRGLIEEFRNLVQVSWLSVHRISGLGRSAEDKSYESTVDRKLEQQANDLVKLFSSLSKQKDVEITSFQQFIFLSLLDEDTSASVLTPQERASLLTQRASLAEIFRELSVPEAAVSDRIQTYFSHSEAIYEKLTGDKSSLLTIDEYGNLLGLVRLRKVIDRWQELQTRLAEIFIQRDRFLHILNSLYRGKKVVLTGSNELQFLAPSDKPLLMRMLSSGEKQLLILLAEALLQRGQPYIYIADEPELSLHVSWQERLVSSLTALNRSAQIIVATHSPDIVGGLSENVIDMASLLK